MQKRVDLLDGKNAFLIENRRRSSYMTVFVVGDYVLDVAVFVAFVVFNGQLRVGNVLVARRFGFDFAKLVDSRGYSGIAGEPGQVMPTLRSRV